MQGTVVAVLRGGASREHAVSLSSGASLVRHLSPERYTVRDIYIDKQGLWHDRGRPTSPERVLPTIDVALLALRGGWGEDGSAQRLLEHFGVAFAGSDSLSAHFAQHKLLAKERVREAGLLVPQYRYAQTIHDADKVAAEAVRAFHQPVVVKPVSWGSSLGVSVVGGYAAIGTAIERLFAEGASGVLVEEYLKGSEASVGLLEDMRGESLYALPVIEVVRPEGGIYSYQAKQAAETRVVVPGHFARKIKEELEQAARKAHQALGLRHYSRSDFIVTPRGIYYLETNSLPQLGEGSLMQRALEAVGISIQEFGAHLVELARRR